MVNILSGYGTHKKTVGTIEWPNNNNNKMKKTYGNQVGINKLCVTKVCLDEIPVTSTFA